MLFQLSISDLGKADGHLDRVSWGEGGHCVAYLFQGTWLDYTLGIPVDSRCPLWADLVSTVSGKWERGDEPSTEPGLEDRKSRLYLK